jgi:hypothetical protein
VLHVDNAIKHIRGHNVPCPITRSALKEHFGVPARANDARLLKAIAGGRNRITAAFERKMLGTRGEPIKLDDADFNHQPQSRAIELPVAHVQTGLARP